MCEFWGGWEGGELRTFAGFEEVGVGFVGGLADTLGGDGGGEGAGGG